MGKINKEGLAKIRKQRQLREESLQQLISTPFDLSNLPQQEKLKKYMDSFELSLNKMYLYQAFSMDLKAIAGCWLVGKFLLPDFINYFLTTFLYMACTANVLESFSVTDFDIQKNEMETIYNWCLKNNESSYSKAVEKAKEKNTLSSLDNTQKLCSPAIQRLISLLAPLYEPEFMIAWPAEITKVKEDSVWSKTIEAGQTALWATFSIFSRNAPLPTIDEQRLKELKVKVENEGFKVGVFVAFEQAIRYFATSTDFRALLASKVEKPLAMIKQVVPEAVLESFHPKLS